MVHLLFTSLILQGPEHLLRHAEHLLSCLLQSEEDALHSAVLDPTQPTLHPPEHLLCCFYCELNNRRKQKILWLFMATPENISDYSRPDHSGQTMTCPSATLQKYNYFFGYLVLLPKNRNLLEQKFIGTGRREKSQYSSKGPPLPLGKFLITCYIQRPADRCFPTFPGAQI